jgi:hypothetical protein
MARHRKRPEPQIGDVHGCMTVVRLLGRGHAGRSEIRVVCKCTCGYEAAMYEHNMYHHGFGKRCTHVPGSRKTMLVESRAPHRIYEEIETLTREERRTLFDRILDNFCCDTGTHDGRPCAEFADEACAHNENEKAG